MKNIKKLDEYHRLTIPKDLLSLIDITEGNCYALCSLDNGFFLRPLNNIKDCKVIQKVSMDMKNRIVFSKSIVGNKFRNLLFEVFVLNGDLHIVPIIDEEIPMDPE